MVNPPRDEIRRIRAQLQGFGDVADASVFYWFQNRKSRSKQKQRNLHSRSRSTTTTTTSEPKPFFQTPGVHYCEPPLVSQIPDLIAIAGTPEPTTVLWSALFEREGFNGVANAPAIPTSTTAAAAAVNEIQDRDSN
ncbi:hypothetical protein J5N97_004332 [Dioscorea zingiberensis]|uniref:Homeobox domain-containing protein n=1 Tax=Dioscorea zingiberensis TaxID=325984 RepID=A0A9D5D6D0_9LILI|nr:hypothetical protein J5N97_004332 [Dioscorea zingiberensis]